MEKARKAYPMLDIDTSATVFTGDLEAAKFKVDQNKSERRPPWDSTGVNWEQFVADMEK